MNQMPRPDTLFYKWGAGVTPDLPVVAAAHDEFLVLEDGTEVVDAAAGAAVVNLGHSVPGVTEAARRQLDAVSYLSLSHFSNDAPERLAAAVADRTPGDLNSVFFTNSGSEAVESAFKLARAYHRARGNPEKHVVVGRWQSYHGATLGALSAGGNTSRRVQYEPLLKKWPHIPPAYPYRWSYEGTPEEQAVAAARELDTAIRQAGPETVAAFVAEPVSGASIPAAKPHPAYYREVRRICDEHDVLFVADEVMTGFGRTGPMFATEHFGVVPDVTVLGKGLSGGYTPISAIAVREDIAAAFGADGDGNFNHGHTFGGNPLSAAIAAHVVEQYTPAVLETGRRRGEQLVAAVEPLRDHPMVGEIRSAGPMVGVEFVADRETKAPFEPDAQVATRIYDEAMDRGVYTYPGTGSVDGIRGDHVMLSPPLNLSEASVEVVGDALVASVEAVHEQLAGVVGGD